MSAARTYDAATETLTVSDDATLDTSNVTVGAWFYLDDLPGNDPYSTSNHFTLASKWTASNRVYLLQALDVDNYIYWTVSADGSSQSGISVKSNAIVSTGSWFHVCGTANGTNHYMYVDGEQQSSSGSSGSLYTSSTADVIFGSDAQGDCVKGRMADARVYNRALSVNEVQEWYAGGLGSLRSGLVCHLPLNSASFVDFTGTGNDATNTSTTDSALGPPIFGSA